MHPKRLIPSASLALPFSQWVTQWVRGWIRGAAGISLLTALCAAMSLSWFERRQIISREMMRLSQAADVIARDLGAMTPWQRKARFERDRGLFPLLAADSAAICTYSPRGIWYEERSAASHRALLPVCAERPKGYPANGNGTRFFERGTLSHPFLIYRYPLPPGRRADGLYQELILRHDLGPLHQVLLLNAFAAFFVAAALAILLTGGLSAHFASRARAWIGWIEKRRKNPIFLSRLGSRLGPRHETAHPKTAKKGEGQPIDQHPPLIVLANREPYIHCRSEQYPEAPPKIVRPASGLVSALEPVLRSSGGLWIAHGSGDRDFEVTDAEDQVAVPPSRPRYLLKRIRMSEEEERGYYYGFANEGLWPLCHLAHTRPVFRLPDWEHYKTINQRFATAVPSSVPSAVPPLLQSLGPTPVILVQDYHFALTPSLIRDRLERECGPELRPRIGLFWHIPWPNPEAFGICPWGKELLEGMLGADVIGFHTQFHCNNFLETCNRYLEARIDWERFSVTCRNRETLVRAFPIGIDTPLVRVLAEREKTELKRRYGIQGEFVAIGVDRLDYTKGLLERVAGVERFLEKNPHWVGRFTLAQIESPSRTQIPAYRELGKILQSEIDRINKRFEGQGSHAPIVHIPEHQDWGAIQDFYQIGDLCMVTSLHDGMNLVAKEYVWCQQPESGSLLLSRFTGASRELSEAFIVNPYSTEEIADAIAAAVELSPEERALRMLSMREKVQRGSALAWARNLISALRETETISPTGSKSRSA